MEWKKDKSKQEVIGMRDMELDHIALIVSTEECLSFYKKLGFIEKNRIERGYDTVVFMECDGLLLEVFIDPNHPERVSGPEALGLRHIAFVVESLEEVMRDVECEEIRTDWFGRRFTFTKDPDGQPIELKEKKNTPPQDGVERNRRAQECWNKRGRGNELFSSSCTPG